MENKEYKEGKDVIFEIVDSLNFIQHTLTDTRRKLENILYNLVGRKFNKLTVIERVGNVRLEFNSYTWIPKWSCICDCGQVIEVTHQDLIYNVIDKCNDCGEIVNESES